MPTAEPWTTPAWSALTAHVPKVNELHLRDLLQDAGRCGSLSKEFDGITLDYSRQLVTGETMGLLFDLARAVGLEGSLKSMARGDKINVTESRAVLHMALRAPKGAPPLVVDGVDVHAQVHEVQDKISAFVDRIRSGKHVGATGKPLTSVVSIGIGGSYLGVEYVYEALRKDGTASVAAQGRTLRFLANVDPTDVARALDGLDPETTLVIVISKTFTTAETMLNARTAREWLVKGLGAAGVTSSPAVVAAHMCAVSTAVPLVTAFGISPDAIFGFWDWVGGRYSVCSAVGVLPLSLLFGTPVVEAFLAGAHSIDTHLLTTPLESNLPVIQGVLGVWNATFLGFPSRALLPYSQALLRLPAHIQQVSMESNGKRVSLQGNPLPFPAGEVEFGEPGTNGQHSFYQLLHQGRTVPADFVGFLRSQTPMHAPGESVSNHDELMSNFFAQPDALAVGKTLEEALSEGASPALAPHKTFPGNRPSLSILAPILSPRTVGQLLALFEHRTAVEGFLWGIPSFDQWGVELGKKLATQVRGALVAGRASGGKEGLKGFNPSTTALLLKYLTG